MPSHAPAATPVQRPRLDDETHALALELFQLVRAGDLTRVPRLLRMGLVPNLRDAKGDSLLMLACYHGHAELAQALLRHGADTELVNDRGQTPLAAAAFNGDATMARLLLDAGADPNARMPGGRTALMLASMFDRQAIVELLIAYGADLHAVDDEGRDAAALADAMGASSPGGRARAADTTAPTPSALRQSRTR